MAPAGSAASPEGERTVGAARRPRDPLRGLGEGVGGRLSVELIDELLAGARSEEEIVGAGGLLADLTRRLVERRWAPS